MDQRKLEMQRIRRAKTGNATTKKYERTKGGKLMRCYRNMMSRVTGIQYKKEHLYLGKEILSREDFYEFSKNDKSFNELFDAWVASDYDRKLTPSVDRIDSNKGYVLGNIQWITHSENSRKGAQSRHSQFNS